MKKTLLSLAVISVLSGCATHSALKEKFTGEQFEAPKIEESKFLKKKENKLRPPQGGPVPVAVYSFQDKTGQRKSMPNIASLSSAVTQGAESYLIKALQDAGDARWFTVLERVGLDNLIKERQMIRQMREAYQGKDAKMLPPMVFAGVIMEGGIIGYDSNTLTGGSGVRVFGIGASTQYQSDTVTVTLRTVSVSTGEILTSVTVTKTVLSYMDKVTLLRFVDDPTNTATGANALGVEGEVGGSINESINKAIDVAVQAAVIQTINEGARKGIWAFQPEFVEIKSPAPVVTEVPKTEEVKKEEPKAIEVKKEEPKAIEVKKEEPVVVPAPSKEEPKVESLPGTMYLKSDSYVYKEADEKSQKTWLLKKGVELSVVDTKGEWVQVRDAQHRRGWVNQDVLINKP
jgi:curli production assembly/transport component CsgG